MGIKASSTRTLSQLGGAQKLSLIGQRCGTNNQLGALGSSTPYTTQLIRMLMPYGADAIQIVYPNFHSTTNGNGEVLSPPNMYAATSVIYSGGTGYNIGDIDTFAISNTTGIAAAKVMITAVSGSVPTAVQIVDGGLYNALLSAGSSPASTSGSGTGATATFVWSAGCMGARIGIEPVWNNLVAAGGGAGAVEQVSKGVLGNGQLNANLLVPLNDFLVSDLIPVDVPVGGAIGIRMSLGYNSVIVGRVSLNAVFSPSAPSVNYESNNNMSSFTDFSVSGSITGTLWDGIIQPIAVLGIPKVQGPQIMAIGDSRCYGQSSGLNSISSYDAMDNDGNLGWLEKALSGSIGKAFYPFSNMSVSSDKLAGAFASPTSLAGRYGRLKAISLARPTAVYVGLNVNDINAGTSLATIQAYEQTLIGELRGLGVKYVFTDTTDPYTTSSDNWASTGNQTLNTYSNNIIQRNQALSAGTWATYDFFIDQRPNVESSINSGKWITNGTANYYTGDGLHASPQLIAIKAATAAVVIAANISV